MKLVTSTSYLGTKFGEEKAIELIAASGFERPPKILCKSE